MDFSIGERWVDLDCDRLNDLAKELTEALRKDLEERILKTMRIPWMTYRPEHYRTFGGDKVIQSPQSGVMRFDGIA